MELLPAPDSFSLLCVWSEESILPQWAAMIMDDQMIVRMCGRVDSSNMMAMANDDDEEGGRRGGDCLQFPSSLTSSWASLLFQMP